MYQLKYQQRSISSQPRKAKRDDRREESVSAENRKGGSSWPGKQRLAEVIEAIERRRKSAVCEERKAKSRKAEATEPA